MRPYSGRREIRHEVLDDLPAGEGERSLNDLVRINRYLGGNRVLRRTLNALVTKADRFSVLDVGAASGDAGREITAAYPLATVFSLDYRLHHMAGAGPLRVAADAFHVPFAPASFDFVLFSLFLHHFSSTDAVRLLRGFGAIARRAVLLNDLERHWLPYYFLPATRWMFRWDSITLHDGPVSVQAAWRGSELRLLASAAGFTRIRVRTYRPAFRIGMIASGFIASGFKGGSSGEVEKRP